MDRSSAFYSLSEEMLTAIVDEVIAQNNSGLQYVTRFLYIYHKVTVVVLWIHLADSNKERPFPD